MNTVRQSVHGVLSKFTDNCSHFSICLSLEHAEKLVRSHTNQQCCPEPTQPAQQRWCAQRTEVV